MFDPTQHKPDPTKRAMRDEYLTKPGIYLVAFTRAKALAVTSKGSPFKAFKTVVIDGPQKGAIFWSDVFFSTGALGRLGALCASMGVTKPFDIESDDAIEHALMGVPFKARVTTRSSGEKVYAKIEFTETDVTSAERRVMDEWVVAHADSARASSAVNGGRGGTRSFDAPMPSDDDISDDDIPF